LYDATITTGEEVRCFWGRKVTGAAILFWLNKYMNAMFLVWLFVTDFKISDEAGTFLLIVSELFLNDHTTSSEVSRAPFIALRVYALQKSLIICAMAFMLALAPLTTNFVSTLQ
ncbi:hypothetical protein DICSQDRAFT_60477, partial [Dichomitus squalens LYAD-421 SS1]